MEPIFAQYKDLVDIPTTECGEELVVVQEFAPEIACNYRKKDMISRIGEDFLIRKKVAKMLKKAAKELIKLMPEAQLDLAYSYRHPDVQEMYFNKRVEEFRKQGVPEKDLVKTAHLLSASPDVAGHITGGAIDITIAINGKEIDMGTGVGDFSNTKKIQFFAKDVGEVQKENRTILRELLMKQGFAPFDYEWWHFSYGDKEWAWYYKKAKAIYDKIYR